MKKLVGMMLWLVAIATVCDAATLEVRLETHGGLSWITDSAQTVSVTRLAFLLSDFHLQRNDGSWIDLPGQFAFIDPLQNRLSFPLVNVPPDSYQQIRFTVGLNEKTNYDDPSQWPADHPLNPLVNGLHWSWQGGYVFFALEGHYNNDAGYSLHLAKSPNQTPINQSVSLDLQQDSQITISLDVHRLLQSIHFAVDAAATHSREGDPLAAIFQSNIARSFSVGAVSTPAATPVSVTVRALVATNATPYHFRVPAGFPMPSLPRDNPLTVEGVALGKRLFHEKLLSRDNTISCAACHNETQAFSDSPRRFSVGVDKQEGTRNAMPLFNLAWKREFFWDGRAASLREQVLMPIQDGKEMHEPLDELASKLAAAPGYVDQFEKAFGAQEISANRVARALEQFVLTLESSDSKFDRALRGRVVLSEEEKRGFELFMTEYDPRRGLTGADCFHCHGGPLFSDFRFTNNGLDADPTDTGRERVTGNALDKGKFAIPSLRNVALTGPYMHDGRFQTLEEVVDHYCTGTKRSVTLDPNLAKHPNGGVPLGADDKKALVAFLKTLTEEPTQH